MGKKLKFISCLPERYDFGVAWNTGLVRHAAVGSKAEVPALVAAAYASDPELAGRVTGLGFGWQRYVIQSNGKCNVTLRGGAGGSCGRAGHSIDPTTGDPSNVSNINKPGRGAKLKFTANFRKNQVLYILVGSRGWCNNGADYGGGGGGASVILTPNSAGAYTFAVTGEKVDVVAVAGGGGGSFDSSFGPSYYGRDAVPNDGSNTNGGSGSPGGSGAGLTGNGTNVNRGMAYSLLSGNPNSGAGSNYATEKVGSWGGGGSPWDGGGGGGGYSGGNTYSNNYGDGGTSYINPKYCIPTFRGFADIIDDAGRRCTNPWSAYGHLEIEIGRDENKLILVKDSEGWKWFNGIEDVEGHTFPTASNRWELLPDSVSLPPDESAYEMYGKRLITNSTGLSDYARFYVCNKETTAGLDIGGNVNGAIVKMSKDALVSHVQTVINCISTANLMGTSVKFAISKNKGNSWLTFEGGEWVPIDISDKDTFQNYGYDFGLISTIPAAKWNSLKMKTLRLAFCITQYDTASSAFSINQMKFLADLTGSWKHATDSQVEYEYVSTDQVSITFKQAGSYKVNYLDSKLNNTTEDDDMPVYLAGASAVTIERAGSGKIALKWKDPEDTVQAGQIRATWAKTVVIVKKDSYAANENDEGVFRTEITTKNQHETLGLEVAGLTNGNKYYVSIIPISADNVATKTNVNRGHIIPKAPATITVTPDTLNLDEDHTTGQFTINYDGDGTLSISHSNTDGVTWSINDNIVTVTATKSAIATLQVTSTDGPTTMKPATVNATVNANIVAYLSTKSVGDTAKIKMDGVTTGFTIVNQGNPDSAIYDASCDGTWLLSTDIYEELPWDANACDNYSGSDIDTYLNGAFLNKFTAGLKSKLVEAKIPYTYRDGNGDYVHMTGQDGTVAKAFLPSALELGFPTDVSDKYTFDGRKLAYFPLGNTTTERAKRIAEFDGEPKMYWLRSLYMPNRLMAYVVSVTGNGTNYQGNSYFGIRFLIILDGTTKINNDGTIVGDE